MQRLAIIPARGGSKRIPSKNIRVFLGKPIITYPIQAALSCGLFNEVMVSTDNDEIARVAIESGAKVPFIRSEKNSNDYATLADVVLEVLDDYARTGISFDILCVLLPTSILAVGSDFQYAYDQMLKNEADAVIPVVQYSYPPQRGLQIQNNILSMKQPEYMNTRTQDLEPIYHDAGQYYFIRTKVFQKEKTLMPKQSYPVILPETQVQDIDNPADWAMAEMKYRLRYE